RRRQRGGARRGAGPRPGAPRRRRRREDARRGRRALARRRARPPDVTARPLAGTRVVVTRAEHQSAGLQRALQALGAEVELLPLLVVLPPADPAPLLAAAARVGEYAWVVLTSANAAEALLPVAPRPWPASVRVAVVGPATARQVAAHGVQPALVAE